MQGFQLVNCLVLGFKYGYFVVSTEVSWRDTNRLLLW